MTQQDYQAMSDAEKKKEDWMNSKWRPAMGWLYMLVCFCDFVLFPVLHAIYIAALYKGAIPPGVPPQWSPLTLQGAGLFHLAMGAVLGIAALGRTQEKMAGANNGGMSLPTPAPTPSFSMPTPAPVAPVAPTPVVSAPMAPKPVVAPAPVVTLSSTGKPMPAPQVDEPL